MRHPSRSNRLARRRPHRTPRTTILLFVEGDKTEYNYFLPLKGEAIARGSLAIKLKSANGGSAKHIILSAKTFAEYGEREYDEIWVVLDADYCEGKTLPELKGLAKVKRKSMDLIFSNPCFEVWVLLHFQRSSRPYDNCSGVVRELSRFWKNEFNERYQKSDPNIYSKTKGRTEDAIENARSILQRGSEALSAFDNNSSSEAYRLVQRLLP